jgi:methionyl-tRNA synthetase
MNRYLTTTLPYVNADQHIGFALEIVQADTLARAWRLQGDDVFFSTGTDEHGQKVYEAAGKACRDVQEYTDEFAGKVSALKKLLNLSTDAFIRTTDPKHYEAAQEIWKRCEAAGDIYKKSYTGLYCVGCEEYKTERELNEEGHCLLHPNIEILTITEENYFFKFSKYADALLSYLARKDSIVPEWRREEAEAFVNAGLHDFSISREKEKLSWGVPVPGDDTQVMYVWFDALTSYISTLGWPTDADGAFEKYWNDGETVQMAGKDQVRFQSLMWQAMLMSANIKNTDRIFYHGFINSDGRRMSKSLGNVIAPKELVDKYGVDATRYLLLRHVHPVDDSDVTWERLDEWYTANLVNGLGNLVARIMKLAEDNLTEAIVPSDASIVDDFETLNDFEFNEYMNAIWTRIQFLDEQITSKEPFKVVKVDAEKGRELIAALAKELYTIAELLAPALPDTSEKIQAAVLANLKPENLFPRLDK